MKPTLSMHPIKFHTRVAPGSQTSNYQSMCQYPQELSPPVNTPLKQMMSSLDIPLINNWRCMVSGVNHIKRKLQVICTTILVVSMKCFIQKGGGTGITPTSLNLWKLWCNCEVQCCGIQVVTTKLTSISIPNSHFSENCREEHALHTISINPPAKL